MFISVVQSPHSSFRETLWKDRNSTKAFWWTSWRPNDNLVLPIFSVVYLRLPTLPVLTYWEVNRYHSLTITFLVPRCFHNMVHRHFSIHKFVPSGTQCFVGSSRHVRDLSHGPRFHQTSHIKFMKDVLYVYLWPTAVGHRKVNRVSWEVSFLIGGELYRRLDTCELISDARTEHMWLTFNFVLCKWFHVIRNLGRFTSSG